MIQVFQTLGNGKKKTPYPFNASLSFNLYRSLDNLQKTDEVPGFHHFLHKTTILCGKENTFSQCVYYLFRNAFYLKITLLTNESFLSNKILQ